jgi:hypothetical protein
MQQWIRLADLLSVCGKCCQTCLIISFVCCRGATPEQPKGAGGGGKPKDLSKKAVLLAGPPGIGKTSSAHIIAK